MESRRTGLQVGAVVLAVVLTGAYVWFRTAEARKRSTASPVTSPTSAPATAPMLMPGSKFSRVYGNPNPDRNTIGAGFRLNNNVSAEFAVGSDTKVGIIDLIPATTSPVASPSTQPAKQP